MQAGKSTLNELFNGSSIFKIPFFQRGYVWSDYEWERCLEDVKKTVSSNQPHFMGALIFKNISQIDSDRTFTIIDGQQRLTTILLLLKVLAEKNNAESEFYTRFYTREHKKSFLHNQTDDEMFSHLFYGMEHPLYGNDKSKVLQCYKYFYESIGEEEFIDHKKVMDLIYFVNIELEKDDDEQEIFETINSLGVALTTGELLKNELFSSEEAEYYYRTWGDAFENLSRRDYWEQDVIHGKKSKTKMLDLFLLSYYYLTADLRPGWEPMGSLFKNYQKLLKIQYPGEEKKSFINDLITTANIFIRNFHSTLLENSVLKLSPVQRVIFIVFSLQITKTIPYILFVLKKADSHEQNKIFSLLEMYLLRRHICNLTSTCYNLQFKQFIREKIVTADMLLEKLKHGIDDTSRIPTERDVINEIFSGDRNLSKNRLGAVILYLLEISNPENIFKLNGFNSYSIVDLLPQTMDVAEDTGRMSDYAKKKHLYACKLLGNFIITPKKISSKKSWGDKKDIIRNSCENMSTVQECLTKERWNYSAVIERTCNLLKVMQQVWNCEVDEDFILPNTGNIMPFIEILEENRDVYGLVQVINAGYDDEIKGIALAVLEDIVFSFDSAKDSAENYFPHLLTEDLSDRKPAKWTWGDDEYQCSHWSELFRDLTNILYNKSPEQMQSFCAYGGDKYICSSPRRDMAKSWTKIGQNCYIYTAISFVAMQKSMLNMLRYMKIDLKEIHVYLK